MAGCEDLRPVIVSGPSGSGKSTLIKHLMSRAAAFRMSISCTTRKMREGEVDGEDYFFLEPAEFEKKIEDGEFFEYQIYNGNYYGTLHSEMHSSGRIVLMDVERKGVVWARERKMDARFVFICCSKAAAEDRLRKRNRKTHLDPYEEKDIQNRLFEYDRDLEVWSLGLYDIRIDNENIDRAIEELCNFLGINQDVQKAKDPDCMDCSD